MKLVLGLLLLSGVALLAGCDQTESVQRGYRGTAMAQFYDPSVVQASLELNEIPPPEFRDPPDPYAPPLADVFQNVQVLNDLTLLEFTRLMQALTTWVAPEQGCEYCHNTDDLAADDKYTKVVARRMLEMTRRINADWGAHVGQTGVTCWTCHRGKNVPTGIWFSDPGPETADITLQGRGGQNVAGVKNNGNAALPYDALTAFLEEDHPVGIQGTRPLAGANRSSIKQAEWTYSLMMYMSSSLGVNCTYCHATRAMGRWEESTPQRTTAWYGIRMVRELNNAYLNPLEPLFPPYRLSPEGDGPKVGCETCHKGAYKPLFGVTMLKDYPELAGVVTERPAWWEQAPEGEGEPGETGDEGAATGEQAAATPPGGEGPQG